MPTELQRTALGAAYQDARAAHPGLLIQRGLATYDEGNPQAKQDLIQRICAIPAGELYRRQYQRWVAATADPQRFRQSILRLQTRLFIGLGAGAMLETGCVVGHSHGVPHLPGSGIKGPVQAWVRGTPFGQRHPDACAELFGAEPNDANPLGLSGVVSFHDAWWVPGSAPVPTGEPQSQADRPLVQEVVTTHHPGYYRDASASAATDFDSPIPNAQVAVHGSFLFVVEGEPAWTALALQMLIDALATRGLGAKTRSGYGLFVPDQARQDDLERERERQAAAAAAQAAVAAQRRAEAAAKAAFDRASPERQQLIRVERALADFLASERSGPREALVGDLNRLGKAAVDWLDRDERQRAADLIEHAFDAIGWSDPGKKRSQRERQEGKRRELLSKLRADLAAPPRPENMA